MVNVLNSWDAENKRKEIMLCWALLKCRHDVVRKQKGLEVKEVIVLAETVLSE